MADNLRPGTGFVFMKVGDHARESLPEIVARKRREIDDEGYALWGYGGNTCHPLTIVQPFARDFVKRDGVIYLFMQPMTSKHFAIPERATESSADGVRWQRIPAAINVRGSRYALPIVDLRGEAFELSLSHTRVAIGNSMGRRGDRYISGRVDKGCLEVLDEPAGHEDSDASAVQIGLVARMAEPYAVLVR